MERPPTNNVKLYIRNKMKFTRVSFKKKKIKNSSKYKNQCVSNLPDLFQAVGEQRLTGH